jgi:hypothetical protein
MPLCMLIRACVCVCVYVSMRLRVVRLCVWVCAQVVALFVHVYVSVSVIAQARLLWASAIGAGVWGSSCIFWRAYTQTHTHARKHAHTHIGPHTPRGGHEEVHENSVQTWTLWLMSCIFFSTTKH